MARLMVVILGCMVLFSCAGQKRQIQLSDTLWQYEQAIRWNAYSQALTMQRKTGQVVDYGALEKVKVTSYHPVSRILSPDGRVVEETVEIRYYNVDDRVEKVLLDTQTWRYDPESKAWWLDGDLPNFTAASASDGR